MFYESFLPWRKPSPDPKLPPESPLPQTAARASRVGEVTRHSTFDSVQQGTSLIRYRVCTILFQYDKFCVFLRDTKHSQVVQNAGPGENKTL